MIRHILMSLLIQNKKNTENTERRKIIFLKEIEEDADIHKTRIKQNNDLARIMCKIRSRNSFKS